MTSEKFAPLEDAAENLKMAHIQMYLERIAYLFPRRHTTLMSDTLRRALKHNIRQCRALREEKK